MERSDNFLLSGTADGRYRLLVESISDYAIYLLDHEGTVVNWNLGAQRFKGYAADEIVGQNFARFYSDEERASGLPQRNLERAAREGRLEDEGWRLREDGSRFWAHVVIDRILDPQGKVIGFAKITRDLTERREQELALRRSQEQFRLLVKGVTDYALYMLDVDGNVASWNSGAERIKGYCESEIIGQHFSRFYTEAERERGEPARNLEIARRTGSVELEGWRIRKDGSSFFAHVVIDALHDESGTPIGFAKVTRDITERRQAQRELDQAREALFQAQKIEAIGQLTGGVAHDFNNLLMAILGSLDIVTRRMPTDPKISPFIDNAVQAAQRGAALTQRMLAFARRQELEMGPVDVVAAVNGMRDLLERALGPSVFLATSFPQNLPKVHTDQAQLESALLNLAVNARDAMPNGGSFTLTAQLREIDGDRTKTGSYVVLSVSDTGEGMDETTLARATEPFFTTKGVGKGTGLGLSMVHGLAEQSGGRFVLQSQKGQGTTAELWLPLASGSQPEAAPAQMPQAQAEAARKRVLVVDDDPLVLLNTVTMAEELGHEVLDAISGSEALRILERETVDLLITDYSMPGMTGGDLAQTVSERWPQTRILVATGYAEMPEAHRGRFERLGKPFTERDLKLAIARVI